MYTYSCVCLCICVCMYVCARLVYVNYVMYIKIFLLLVEYIHIIRNCLFHLLAWIRMGKWLTYKYMRLLKLLFFLGSFTNLDYAEKSYALATLLLNGFTWACDPLKTSLT